METLNVTLTAKEMESLEFLTQGQREVNSIEFINSFPQFLPEELREIGMYCNRIKFCLR